MGKVEVVVLGGHVGESVLIKTPGGRWGVIDAHAHGRGDHLNPTLHALEPLTEPLAFALVTHPHDDHFRGMPGVIGRHAPERLWMPPGNTRDMRAVKALLENKGAQGHLVESPAASAAKAWLGLLSWCAAHPSRVRTTQRDDRPLYEEREHDFRITALAPTWTAERDYWGAATGGLEVLLEDADEATERRVHQRAAQNRLSAVLLVEFGSWSALLAGDAEKAELDAILESHAQELSIVNLVKVAHHGSGTSSYPGFWRAVGGPACEAVLTRFDRHGLPDRDGCAAMEQREPALKSVTDTSRASEARASVGGRRKQNRTPPRHFYVEMRTTGYAGGEQRVESPVLHELKRVTS